MVKHFERHGGHCLLWLDKWMGSRGIEPTDRRPSSLVCACARFHYMATYDQLNIGASTAAENTLLRVARIVEAYRSDPKRPNWASVKHLSGLDDAMDPVERNSQ